VVEEEGQKNNGPRKRSFDPSKKGRKKRGQSEKEGHYLGKHGKTKSSEKEREGHKKRKGTLLNILE